MIKQIDAEKLKEIDRLIGQAEKWKLCSVSFNIDSTWRDIENGWKFLYESRYRSIMAMFTKIFSTYFAVDKRIMLLYWHFKDMKRKIIVKPSHYAPTFELSFGGYILDDERLKNVLSPSDLVKFAQELEVAFFQPR